MPIALLSGPQDPAAMRAAINQLIEGFNAAIVGGLDIVDLPAGGAPDGSELLPVYQGSNVNLTVAQLRTSASGTNGSPIVFVAGNGTGGAYSYGGYIYTQAGSGDYYGGYNGMSAGFGGYFGGYTRVEAGGSYGKGGDVSVEAGYGVAVGGDLTLSIGQGGTPGNLIILSIPIVAPSVSGAVYADSVTGALIRVP